MSWTPERVEALKRDWDAGYTCSQIANRLSRDGGYLTRNAVIGKVTRLGLPARQQTRRWSTRPSQRPADAWFKNRHDARMKAKPNYPKTINRNRPKLKSVGPTIPIRSFATAPLPDTPEPIIPLDQRKGVLDLKANDCRWPIGDPQKPDFHFCGHAKHPGFVYCEFHAAKAYVPPQSMKERPYFNSGQMHRKLKAA
jgi:GcrA cell cycle regulator